MNDSHDDKLKCTYVLVTVLTFYPQTYTHSINIHLSINTDATQLKQIIQKVLIL